MERSLERTGRVYRPDAMVISLALQELERLGLSPVRIGEEVTVDSQALCEVMSMRRGGVVLNRVRDLLDASRLLEMQSQLDALDAPITPPDPSLEPPIPVDELPELALRRAVQGQIASVSSPSIAGVGARRRS